ncbi:MAG: FAD-binding oxidoreductase [Corynebacteriales bacterium]|nr:FAD-binding oxidoreductase [Mycobacteriales bacterium]
MTTVQSPTTHTEATDPIVALRGAVTGVVAGPDDPEYRRATPWNVAVPVTPRALVIPTDADDVAATIRIAADHGLTVAVASTGHGAVATDESSILIHTGALTECTVDATTRTARVGAGVMWQTVMDAAAPHGLAPLVGSTPALGVVGFLTGGGIGPMVRTYGASSDHVRAFDLVTGAGEQLRATATENPDLFWGLRGGKGTLGIVTAVEIELVALTQFFGGALYFAAADAPAVLRAWRDWSADLPEDTNTSIAFLQLPPLPDVPPPLAGAFTVAVRYTSVADAEQAAAVLAPMRAVAEPIIDMIGVMPYSAIGAVHSDPVDPMPAFQDHTLLASLPADAVEALLAVTGPDSGSPQTIVELRRLGGALARPAADPSAFCHRDVEYTLMVIGVLAPEIAAVVPVHANSVIAAMSSWSTGGELPNFAHCCEPAHLARRYDEKTFHRLADLAERHDPAKVLAVGHAVRHMEPFTL